MSQILFFLIHALTINDVFGVDEDEVKSVSVMEGDSVTLHTNFTEIQAADHIVWMFVPDGTSIAAINTQANLSFIYGDGRFRDKLKLNTQTGSLTITNIRITDSGDYKLQINNYERIASKRFSLAVYARLLLPILTSYCSQNPPSSKKSSNCSVLCSVMNVTQVSLSWYKGNSLLSSISVSDLNIRLSLPLEVEYQDTNTYRCVVFNPVSNQTQQLDINELCESCSAHMQKPHWVGITVFLIMLVVVTLAVGVKCFLYSWKTRHMRDVESQ